MGGARMERGGLSWQKSIARHRIRSAPLYSLPFSVPNIASQESGERVWCRAQKGRSGQPREGNCPCPSGQMEVSIQGGGKQPPSLHPPPISRCQDGLGVQDEPPQPPFFAKRWWGRRLGVPQRREWLEGGRGREQRGRGEWSAGRGVGVGWSRGWEEPSQT